MVTFDNQRQDASKKQGQTGQMEACWIGNPEVLNCLEICINEMLEEELSRFLNYRPYDRTVGDNARNGAYTRKLKTPLGKISVRIPRDRKAIFKSCLLPKYTRQDITLTPTILDIFLNVMSEEEICDHVAQLCGYEYERSAVAELQRLAVKKAARFKRCLENQKL